MAEENLDASVVDGKSDSGVDFISRENGVVLIVQAKYSGGKKLAKRPLEDAGDFEYFRSTLGRRQITANQQHAAELGVVPIVDRPDLADRCEL